MKFNIFDLFQFVGGFIALFGCIPQIWQTYKTKSVGDLNLKSFMAPLVATILFELYATNLVLNGSGLMYLLTNSFCMMTSLVMVIMIVKYKK
jgi:MtN3 and saliva related transmembrane protein